MMWLLFLIAPVLYVFYRVGFWINEGRKLQNIGYLPPAPSTFGRILFALLSRLGIYLFVGPIQVSGKENISFNEKLVVISNHQFPLDFMVLACALPFHFRHLAKADELHGWRAPLAACTGHFAVHVENGRAKFGSGPLTVDACARVLMEDSNHCVLIFPQGKIVAENILREDDFRTGTIRAVQLAIEKTTHSLISVLPVAIQYNRDPRRATFSSRIAARFGLRCFDGNTNYGASVTIGKPILLHKLPADVKQATHLLRDEIQALLENREV